MTQKRHDYEQLRDLADQGYSCPEIADLTDSKYTSVKAALSRAGINVEKAAPPEVFEIADDMPLREGYELQQLIIQRFYDAYVAPDPIPSDIIAWGIKFTPAEIFTVACLYRRRDSLATKDQLLAAVQLSRPEIGKEVSEQTVPVIISRIRKKIPRELAEIVNVWGVGYRLRLNKGQDYD